MSKLSGIRKSYELGSLDEAQAPARPLELFQLWMDQALAAGVPEPTAMTLATVGADARPSTRIVLLKICDERGLAWFTNYDSRKGRELAAHPQAALQFHWVEQERQVRIEGVVEKTEPSISDDYFRQRPPGSRIGAWASPQSSVVASRAVLEEAAARRVAEFGDDPPRPPHWGGYRLRPDRFEFWQGRPDRLHDRLHYRLADDGRWVLERLAP
ncbi:MAG: pyridoxamine 5'-phosphate oxidase [Aquabacterium sp.]|jgi:pyridoxamine 5'-phosphate oxidase|nr:MAG: pyridoxamine 5'-phosphate oxidase [Aquabacterium sp.]